MRRNPYKAAPIVSGIAPVNTWLIVLRAKALEDWLLADSPRLQKRGAKGFRSICFADTALVNYLSMCTHGMEIGAADRAFVVTAPSPREAAIKGMQEFNASTARMYRPLNLMAIERALPGPVYMAEILDLDSGSAEYLPFTAGTKHEVGEYIQKRAGQFGDVNDYQVKAAIFTRTPAAFGRRFLEGSDENVSYGQNVLSLQQAVADDFEDQMREMKDEVSGPGFEVGLPKQFWSDAMFQAYERGDENAFDDSYIALRARNREEARTSGQREAMKSELERAFDPNSKKLTGNPLRSGAGPSVRRNWGSYKAAIPIVSGVAYVANPLDLQGRHIPERYLAGLPPTLRKQRIRELTHSRDAYSKGDYSELPTDRTARKMGLVKQSKYTTEAKKRGIEYRGNFHDMAKRTLEFYSGRAPANEVAAFAEALKKSFAKGLAAWKSGGHRPGATAQNWAIARVNSLVVGGKTSWTADKKQFAVLPDAVREKIEAMRAKQNPIKVEVHGKPNAGGGSRHSRFFASQAALDRIEAQGADVAPNIKFIIEWDPARTWGNRIMKGMPGIITLLASPDAVESFHDSVTQFYGDIRRTRISPYTAHTILHRLGDKIMPDTDDYKGAYITSAAKREMAKVGYVPDRAEAAYDNLKKALSQADFLLGNYAPTVRGKTVGSVNEWLPLVVDTKACREGWIDDAGQAMAELVPYRLLYKSGREQGVKLLSDLPFVPRLEAALTEYIDANLEMVVGYLVEI